jgi:hypothetical protein
MAASLRTDFRIRRGFWIPEDRRLPIQLVRNESQSERSTAQRGSVLSVIGRQITLPSQRSLLNAIRDYADGRGINAP